MDSHGLLPLLCILRYNYTKAAVSLLGKFSKHRITSSNKLYMKRWHCIFNTIVKESALKRSFIFHFCICLRIFFFFCFCYYLCVPVISENCSTDILPERPIQYLVNFQSQIYFNKLSLSSGTECLYHRRDFQDQPDKHHQEPVPILVSSILTRKILAQASKNGRKPYLFPYKKFVSVFYAINILNTLYYFNPTNFNCAQRKCLL